MLNLTRFSFTRLLSFTLATAMLLGFNTQCVAWSHDGHSAVGILTVDQLNADALLELGKIIDTQDEKALSKACNWPDELRETEEGDSTSPFHYINIPRGSLTYLKARDCPEKQCVTEAIKHYAAELQNLQAAKEQRWQAFAWLCHLTGDLHQPLHAGFADDRGGNNVDVVFESRQINLHRFWDYELINHHAGSAQKLVELLGGHSEAAVATSWSATMTDEWTSESHMLSQQFAYPPSTEIDEVWLQQSWQLAQKRISTAAQRLALIINSVLAEPR